MTQLYNDPTQIKVVFQAGEEAVIPPFLQQTPRRFKKSLWRIFEARMRKVTLKTALLVSMVWLSARYLNLYGYIADILCLVSVFIIIFFGIILFGHVIMFLSSLTANIINWRRSSFYSTSIAALAKIQAIKRIDRNRQNLEYTFTSQDNKIISDVFCAPNYIFQKCEVGDAFIVLYDPNSPEDHIVFGSEEYHADLFDINPIDIRSVKTETQFTTPQVGTYIFAKREDVRLPSFLAAPIPRKLKKSFFQIEFGLSTLILICFTIFILIPLILAALNAPDWTFALLVPFMWFSVPLLAFVIVVITCNIFFEDRILANKIIYIREYYHIPSRSAISTGVVISNNVTLNSGEAFNNNIVLRYVFKTSTGEEVTGKVIDPNRPFDKCVPGDHIIVVYNRRRPKNNEVLGGTWRGDIPDEPDPNPSIQKPSEEP
jgi:hypothetical protein